MHMLLLLLVGCYKEPDLPLIDEVPIEPAAPCDLYEEQLPLCVIDGDTFDIADCFDDGDRIRLLGLDTPELAHAEGEVDECYGPEARDELEKLLVGSQVKLYWDSSTFDLDCKDVFGRWLSYVRIHADDLPVGWGDEDLDTSYEEYPLSVNEWMLRYGFARVYEDAPDVRMFDRYKAIEGEARSAGRGLWSACESSGT